MNIKVETTDKVLSAHGGLIIFKTLAETMKLRHMVEPLLPSLVTGTARSWYKFQGLMMGLVTGAECLDDMSRLAEDKGFVSTLDGDAYTAKAYGDFLREFSPVKNKELSTALIDMAYQARGQFIDSERRSITFDFDSTSNEQHGKKMEGLATNYKGIWGLDTYQVYDEFGFQYDNIVRPGNTYSSNGTAEVLHRILSRMPKDAKFKNLRRYSRADSAFCNSEYMNACLAKNMGFVTSMKQIMLETVVHQVNHWEKTNPKKEKRIKFYDGRECEIGETLYKSSEIPKVLRVVTIRAVKEGREKVLFKQESDYDHRAWLTNIGEHEMSSEQLIKFYRKRGQAENYIRESKYGFDMKHYPCQKLAANNAYGLIAAFAFNLMRFIALKDCFETPHFAKNIRFRLIHLAVQVVRHAGQVVFRFSHEQFREVQHWLHVIKNLQFGTA